jgi:hypothetical protein
VTTTYRYLAATPECSTALRVVVEALRVEVEALRVEVVVEDLYPE